MVLKLQTQQTAKLFLFVYSLDSLASSSQMSSEDYRQSFLANHSRLVRKLTPFEFIQAAYTAELITLPEKEEVESFKTDSQKVNRLLGIFHRRYNGSPDIFKKVFDLLVNINAEEGGYIDHVITKLEESIENPPNFPSSHDLLSEEDRARLMLHESTILRTIDVEKILPDLISEGVVSHDESETIESILDLQERNLKFLKFLKSRGSETYHRFVNVLIETEVYESLGHLLLGTGNEGIDEKKYGEMV